MNWKEVEGNLRNLFYFEIVKDTLQPTKKAVEMFVSPKYLLHKQRKLLQKVQVGKGIMSA